MIIYYIDIADMIFVCNTSCNERSIEMKRVSLIITTIIWFSLFSFFAFASEWKQEADGRWWYQHDDGTYTTNNWELIDGKYYYFDAQGWMLANTTTPDGFQVDVNGAKIVSNTTVSSETESSGMTPRQLSFMNISSDGKYYLNDTMAKEIVSTNALSLKYVIFSIGKYESAEIFSEASNEFILDAETHEVMGEGWYYVDLLGDPNQIFVAYVGPNHMVMRNYTTPDGYQTNEYGFLTNKENGWQFVYYPISDNRVKKIGGSTNQSQEEDSRYYVNGSTAAECARRLFSSIKAQYSSATPVLAYCEPFTNCDGEACIYICVRYRIVSLYDEEYIYNVEKGTVISNPQSNYERRINRAYGRNKTRLLDEKVRFLTCQQNGLLSFMQYNTNGSRTGSKGMLLVGEELY